jgi:hypothetical protein
MFALKFSISAAVIVPPETPNAPERLVARLVEQAFLCDEQLSFPVE